jgi:hypothetical protein
MKTVAALRSIAQPAFCDFKSAYVTGLDVQLLLMRFSAFFATHVLCRVSRDGFAKDM